MNKQLITLCVLSAGSLPAGEHVSIGVRGGVPITDAFDVVRGGDPQYTFDTKRYVVGPAFEAHVVNQFTIQADALYRRLGYQYTSVGPVTYANTVANAWEFPVQAKFEILPGPIRPFVSGGGSFRHLTGVKQIRQVISGATFNQVEVTGFPEFNKRNDIGFVFGAGISFKLGGVRISPEFRYTRWGGEAFRDPVRSVLRTNRNQGDFLLGLTF